MIGKMVVLYDFSRRREGERDSETLDRYSGYFAFAKMKSATSTCSRIPIRVIKYLSRSSTFQNIICRNAITMLFENGTSTHTCV